LDLEIERIYYWTDSMSVLKCINNESKRFHTFESNKSDDPEVRKEPQIYATTVRCNVLEMLISHHSSWWKLKCSVAWLLRCKECLGAKMKLKKSSVVVDTEVETTANVGRLTIEELKAAQDEILRHVQLTAFPEELKILTVADGRQECHFDSINPSETPKKGREQDQYNDTNTASGKVVFA
jgi:hypothetical protein